MKFSAEYKGPSRAWPKAGFTALLVNLAVCAYIFKTQLRSTRLEGIALSETILYLFSLRPSISPPLPALPSLPPSLGWFLPLPFHAAGPEPRVSDGYDVVGRWRISRENLPSPLSLSLPFPAKKGMPSPTISNSSPGFPPFAPLGDDASDAAQLNF